MSVGWLLCSAAAVPGHDGWVGAAERERLASFALPRRRADFRLGRYAAKCAVANWLGATQEPMLIEIRAAEDGAPEAWRDGTLLPCTLSLSHRGGWALCAVAPPGTAIGCDLERIEPRAPSFEREWLCAAEREFLVGASGEGRDLLVTLSWSAKESALKALRSGLRRDPRDVRVAPAGVAAGRGALTVDCAPDLAAGFPEPRALSGFWERRGAFVRTVVAETLKGVPQVLGNHAGAERY